MLTIEDKLNYELNYNVLPTSTCDAIIEVLDFLERCDKEHEHICDLYLKSEEKVKALNKKIKTLKKKTEWISIEERLPKKFCEYYLVIYKGKVEFAYFQHGGFRLDDEYGYIYPTHWMPLPKAPKITKKKETAK